MEISINDLLHIIPSRDVEDDVAGPAFELRTKKHYALQRAIKRTLQYLGGLESFRVWLWKDDEWGNYGKLKNGKSFLEEKIRSSNNSTRKTAYQEKKFNFPEEVVLSFCGLMTVFLCTNLLQDKKFQIAGDSTLVSYQSLRDSASEKDTARKNSYRMIENGEHLDRIIRTLDDAMLTFRDGFESGVIAFQYRDPADTLDSCDNVNSDLQFDWWLSLDDKYTDGEGDPEKMVGQQLKEFKFQEDSRNVLINIRRDWMHDRTDLSSLAEALLLPQPGTEVSVHDRYDKQLTQLLAEIRKEWRGSKQHDSNTVEKVIRHLTSAYSLLNKK